MTRRGGCGRLFQWGGGGGEQRHPGGREGSRVCLFGKNEKGAERGEEGERVSVAPHTDAEQGAECEGGRQMWPGQEAWGVRLFWKQHFGFEHQELCATGRGAWAGAVL